ncbi:hypothetical protein [Staphylococcus aureus]|uniref:hypothetical protein n=1 Tax=Staphylococcus aureus TaxID=1280 RepID=UPI000AE7BBEA|nr:hypothetical protein [Staphylococcus aureus]
MQVGVGPNTEAGEKSAYKNVQVGGAPTERNRITNFNRQCKLAGPQQREIGSPISTDNASWRGPNTENFKKKFYKQCKLEKGPNTEGDEKSAYNNVQVGGAPT